MVSHPEMSLVLQMTDMSRLPQVQAAIASGAPSQGFADDAHALDGSPVLAAYAKIAPSSWTVFVEQPRAEAIAPLMSSIERSGGAVMHSLWSYRASSLPTHGFADRELRRVPALGAGDFAHRIEVSIGDELQSSRQFPRDGRSSCARFTRVSSIE